MSRRTTWSETHHIGVERSKFAGPDHELARLAARQEGLVTRPQLLAAGLGRGAIAQRTASGRLYPVLRGVYAVGHAPLSPAAHDLAAVLSCGDGTALSGASSLAFWRLLPRRPATIHVIVHGSRLQPRPGVTIHRLSQPLDPRDVRRRGALAVTSPARAIVEVARSTDAGELERVVAEAQAIRLAGEAEIRAALARAPAWGAGRLRAILDDGGAARTRSEAERRLLALIRAADLPRPATNARLLGFEVDFLWREERLVVEVDGFAFHGSRRAFERDRARDATLAGAGYRVIRVTWRQLERAPREVIASLSAALAAPKT